MFQKWKKCFKQKPREFIASQTEIQEILKEEKNIKGRYTRIILNIIQEERK